MAPLSRTSALLLAPTEDDSRNLKRVLAKTLVLVSSNGVVIRIKMPREVARTTCMAPRRWALGQKFSKPACSNFLRKKILRKDAKRHVGKSKCRRGRSQIKPISPLCLWRAFGGRMSCARAELSTLSPFAPQTQFWPFSPCLSS